MLREKVAIITDSCADVPEELAEKYHLFVLPMQIVCEDGVYRDGIDMTSEDIYKRLEKETPKSSTPSGADVEDLLQELVRQGYKKAIAVLLAGGLSGTVNQVRLLAEEFGGIAIQTAKYAEEGMEFEELKEKVERLIERTKVFFSIDTLKYLKRGGRIGKAAALAGTPYKKYALEGKEFIRAKYYMYISASKNGEQYLDSLGGMAGASEEGSYEEGYFLLPESFVNPEAGKDKQEDING